MFLFHTGLAVTTLVLGNRDLTVPLYKTVLDFKTRGEILSGESTSGGSADGPAWELIPSYVQSGAIPITWFVATFFVLSAMAHLLNVTLLRRYYFSQLAKCCTPTRWIEYFFSAPVMMIIIAYMLGIRDRAVIISIAVLIAITMPFGYWVEHVARPKSSEEWHRPLRARLMPFFLGHVPQVTAWFLIVLQFYDGQADISDRAPDFVHVILWGELALFFSFGGAALYAQLQPPRRFYVGEIIFQILSLVSKGLLGALLIANVLILSQFEELYD